jgi:hypothetical protein
MFAGILVLWWACLQLSVRRNIGTYFPRPHLRVQIILVCAPYRMGAEISNTAHNGGSRAQAIGQPGYPRSLKF